jgi:Radical SAM superfamily
VSVGRLFRIVLVKPSKYARDGYVERFRKGFMPNATLLHLKSMTPQVLGGRPVSIETVDEYTQTDLRYLDLLRPEACSLLVMVGVQSHQMHRALDLTALAQTRGVRNCVIGGPHVMTCDTSEVHGRCVSFALAEAELVWPLILRDALEDDLRRVYDDQERWQNELTSTVLVAPTRSELRPCFIPMVGIYPARGCPFNCNFCSVVKIAGRKVRSQSVEATLRTLLAAREAGVRLVMFTSDNFNKYAEATTLLEAMIDARIGLPFFVQCDAQVGRDEEFIKLMARAGCAQVFVGVESFNRAVLEAIRKFQNQPALYADIVGLCHKHGISTHFSNILGFPDQNETAILQHLRELHAVHPFLASFYILTPIPGTDQYEEFRKEGLIVETNLDRFDGTCSVWRHPHLSAEQLEDLLFRAYREFYTAGDILAKLAGHRWKSHWFVNGAVGFGYSAFARFAASKRMHPMAGGFCRMKLDKVDDYLPLRKRVFGINRLEMPTSLSLAAN